MYNRRELEGKGTSMNKVMKRRTQGNKQRQTQEEESKQRGKVGQVVKDQNTKLKGFKVIHKIN